MDECASSADFPRSRRLRQCPFPTTSRQPVSAYAIKRSLSRSAGLEEESGPWEIDHLRIIRNMIHMPHMTGRLISYLAAITMLGNSSGISAQEANQAPSDEFFVTDAWSDPSECNQKVARAVSFATLTADFKTLRGECIQVEGY